MNSESFLKIDEKLIEENTKRFASVSFHHRPNALPLPAIPATDCTK